MLPVIYDKQIFKVITNGNRYYYGMSNSQIQEVNKTDLMYIEKISSKNEVYGLTHILNGYEVIIEYFKKYTHFSDIGTDYYSVYFANDKTKYTHYPSGNLQSLEYRDKNRDCKNVYYDNGVIESETFFKNSDRYRVKRNKSGLINSITIDLEYNENSDYCNDWHFRFNNNKIESYCRENGEYEYEISWSAKSDNTEIRFVNDKECWESYDFGGLLIDQDILEMFLFGTGLNKKFEPNDLLIDSEYYIYFGDLIK